MVLMPCDLARSNLLDPISSPANAWLAEVVTQAPWDSGWESVGNDPAGPAEDLVSWSELGVGETSLCNCHLLEGQEVWGLGSTPSKVHSLASAPSASLSFCHILSPQCYIPQRKVILHSRPEDYGSERSRCCPGNTLSHRYPPPPTKRWVWG